MTQQQHATDELTVGQKAWLAVGIAKAHDLSIATGIALADTVAQLLPILPADATRRCHICGTPIGPHEQWCSRSCFRADEGDDVERDYELEDVGR